MKQEILPCERANLRDQIFAQVIQKYGLTKEEILGRYIDRDLTKARHELATRLHASGFSGRRIAQIMQRQRRVIDSYLYPNTKAARQRRDKLRYLVDALPDGVRDVIKGMAEAEGIAPVTLVREWLVERANYEAAAKARAA